MRFLLAFVCSIGLAGSAVAQVTPTGLAIVSETAADTRDSIGGSCSDMDGGPGFTSSTSSCSDAQGETAASSAQTTATSDARGGDFAVVAQAGATAVPAPGPQQAFGLATAGASALENWTLSSDTFYVVSLSTASDPGGPTGSASATATFSGGGGAPSGLLTAGVYALQATADASALARETGPVTSAASGSATARVTFAPAVSSTLVRGVVTAGGLPRAGLLVEALDGPVVLDSGLSGDDGSYLLPDVTSPATIRFSDPAGNFQTFESGVVTPPAVVNADLLALPTVPALPAALVLVLALALLAVARGALGRRAYGSATR